MSLNVNACKDDKTAKVVLISCVKSKLGYKAKARNLYTSPLFRYELKYAQRLTDEDKIFILSAKYGLVPLEEELEPYEATLNNKPADERRQWADRVFEQLQESTNVATDGYVILAGNKYSEFIANRLDKCSLPLSGMSIGKRLNWLKVKTHATKL